MYGWETRGRVNFEIGAHLLFHTYVLYIQVSEVCGRNALFAYKFGWREEEGSLTSFSRTFTSRVRQRNCARYPNYEATAAAAATAAELEMRESEGFFLHLRRTSFFLFWKKLHLHISLGIFLPHTIILGTLHLLFYCYSFPIIVIAAYKSNKIVKNKIHVCLTSSYVRK